MEITNIIGKLPRNGSYMKRPLSAITKIAVHWDAWDRPHEYDSVQRFIQEAQMHIDKDWGGGAHGDGLMYHFKIDNVGEVFQCREMTDVLWNVGGNANYWTLAICFDCGEFQSITKEQGEAFLKLMEELCYNHPELPASQGDVAGHREFNPTQCPGNQIMNKLIIPYRNNRTVDLTGLVYDWPQENPVPVPAPTPTPAPVTPEPVITPAKETVVESPANEHVSQEQAEIAPTQDTTTPDIAPSTPTEEKPQEGGSTGFWELIIKVIETIIGWFKK